MLVPYYLLTIPIALIFFGLGLMACLNKLDIRGYGIEEFIHNVDDEKREKVRPTNKSIGILSIAFSIIILAVLPWFIK